MTEQTNVKTVKKIGYKIYLQYTYQKIFSFSLVTAGENCGKSRKIAWKVIFCSFVAASVFANEISGKFGELLFFWQVFENILFAACQLQSLLTTDYKFVKFWEFWSWINRVSVTFSLAYSSAFCPNPRPPKTTAQFNLNSKINLNSQRFRKFVF